MEYRQKIKTREELARVLTAEKARGKRIVHCHGCFDILHPGHVRHLAWAKQQGDILVVTVSSDAVVQKGPGRPFVPEELRAENLAALGFVDYVAVDDGLWAGPILELLKPDIYVKGKEFEHVYTGRIGRERTLVQSYGGKVLFSSGDVVYSSTAIYQNKSWLGLPDERLRRFRQRNGIGVEELRRVLLCGEPKRVVVLGDVVLRQESRCAPTPGLSPSAYKVTQGRLTLDGACTVAEHLHRLGAHVRLLSCAGNDERGDAVEARARELGLAGCILRDPTRPTALLRQYRTEEGVLFEGREFENHPLEPALEEKLLAAFRRHAKGAHAVVVVDMGAGAVGENLLAEVRMQSRFASVPSVGLVDPLHGFPPVRRLEGLSCAVAREDTLRLGLCDGASGVAEIAACAIRSVRCGHLAVCLSDGGLLLLRRPPRDRRAQHAEAAHELRAATPTDYLPCFGPTEVGYPRSALLLVGPLAYALAQGAPLMAAGYIAMGSSCVLSSSRLSGGPLRHAVLRCLLQHSFLPDERAAMRCAVTLGRSEQA